jgi:hypothetical protein
VVSDNMQDIENTIQTWRAGGLKLDKNLGLRMLVCYLSPDDPRAVIVYIRDPRDDL